MSKRSGRLTSVHFAKMSGLTETEALKTWTPLLFVLGIAAFLSTCLAVTLMPLR